MNKLVPFALMLAFVPLTASAGNKASCGTFPAVGFDGPDMSRFVGEYSNPNYGFAVRIPDGFVGHNSPPPMPHHGFGVVLSWEPRAYIDFDGSYTVETDASTDPSVAQVQSRSLQWLREESERIISVRTTRVRLGPLPARRHVVYRTCEGRPGVFVVDEVVALSGNITYTATLLSVAGRYARDRNVFGQILRTWRLSEIK
jgi:hypothetical protein